MEEQRQLHTPGDRRPTPSFTARPRLLRQGDLEANTANTGPRSRTTLSTPGQRPRLLSGPFRLATAYNKDANGAIREYQALLRINPDDAKVHNNVAWVLASAPVPEVRDPARAVSLAKKAVELAPTEGTFRNTLGVAHYRAGDWNAALPALEKSMELRKGGDSFDWFLLAMAYEKLGDTEKARQWYQRATVWMEKNQAANEELRRFRAEAAQVLEVDKKRD